MSYMRSPRGVVSTTAGTMLRISCSCWFIYLPLFAWTDAHRSRCKTVRLGRAWWLGRRGAAGTFASRPAHAQRFRVRDHREAVEGSRRHSSLAPPACQLASIAEARLEQEL